ncbi:MAG: histidinol dehydrogenase [bacterium]
MGILRYSEDKKVIEEIKNKGFDEKIIEKTKEIIFEVKKNGDASILKFTKQFDKISLSSLRVDERELSLAYKEIKKEDILAIKKAIKNISDFHKKQLRKPWKKTKKGKTIGGIIRPIKRVGLYIPCGKFPLVSTLLMTAIPAKIAGVSEIAVACPSPINPYILGVCHLLEINEVYQMGGAQAIAALAYGTETIKRVDLIAGPGNIYVTIAKRLVFGDVGIDLLAGPSEILIIADSSCNPSFVSLDLSAQAEHGIGGFSILITTSESLAKEVEKNVGDKATIIITKNLGDACFLSNLFSPEHLCLYTKNPETLLKKIENAGAIFLGEYSPVALGDYIAGPSHVLPTSQTARFLEGLSVSSFQKRISLISYSKDGVLEDRDAIRLAEIEGLIKHKESMKARIDAL